MKLRVGKRAQRQATEIERWWSEHRPAAGSLFIDELQKTFQLLTEMPAAGVRWPTRRSPDVRRILMPNTGNHVYYAVDDTGQTVLVLAVWGAPRGRRPKV